MTSQATSYIQAHSDSLIDDWIALLRIPSISAQPEHKLDMAAVVDWLKAKLTSLGFSCRICETDGHPALLAARSDNGSRPTVLVYGHYDVQPVGDESLWESPPFEPVIRDGQMVARGAADDKGQLLTVVAAVEAWLATHETLPINLKFLLEGEEEVGSPHLAGVIEANREALACDLVWIADTAQFRPGLPAITVGTKGLIYKEVRLTGPAKDLHSGSFGGTVANPANVVCELIAAMKGLDGRVKVPGFYDDVAELTEAERAAMSALDFDEAGYVAGLGSLAAEGEPRYSTLERRWARPTLDVNGLRGGYQGDGASTIVPAKAGVKFSMRLVPDQDPEAISGAVDALIHAVCDGRVGVEIFNHGQCRAYMAPIEGAAVQAGMAAIEAGFGVRPVLIREGGTLPILPTFKALLGADCLMTGYCRPDCNAHSPNEFFGVDDFLKGAVSNVHLLAGLSMLNPSDLRR